jgi:UDP-N-acetylmuramoylalanine--D-glutamate ligase
VDEVGLLGAYNLQNVCAALSASWQLVPNAEAAGVAIREFKGLEHRLEFVAKKRGVKFYNDSFSSAPTATMAAITAFTEPIVLVMGGYDKGVDLLPLARRVAETKNIERVVLIGQVRGRIATMFMQLGFDRYTVSDSMSIDEIVAVAVSYAPQGGVVLLSPGCASFDMFKNFYERGTLFKQAVKELRE